MRRPLTVYRCDGCGRAVFPRRLACFACGGSEWTELDAGRGVVEASTTRLHRAYEEKRDVIGGWMDRAAVPLAAVRTEHGPVVIARLDRELAPGTRVLLFSSSGAAVAEPELEPPDDLSEQVGAR